MEEYLNEKKYRQKVGEKFLDDESMNSAEDFKHNDDISDKRKSYLEEEGNTDKPYMSKRTFVSEVEAI